MKPDQALFDSVAKQLLAHAGLQSSLRRRLPSSEDVSAALEVYRDVMFPEYRLGDGTHMVERLEDLHTAIEALVCADETTTTPEDTAVDQATSIVAALPRLRTLLEADLQAALRGDPAARSTGEVVRCYPGFLAVEAYRFAHELWKQGALLCARLITEQAHRDTGIDIHPGASIAGGLFIDHGTGVVIGETSIIGTDVRIYQGVTIGARSVGPTVTPGEKRHPTVEDGVIIYANATILGGDTVIGEGAIIGGNAWVTTSVPAGARLRIDVAARVADAVIMVPEGAQP